MVWLFRLKRIFILTALLSASSGLGSQTSLVKIKVKLNSQTLEVELANTDASRSAGLMHRKSLEKNSGMIFIFPDEAFRSFWMKNTFVPLSIGYFDAKRVLKQILDMAATTPQTTQHLQYPSREKAKYALEVNQGWFKQNKIEPGAILSFVGKEPAGL